MDKGRILGASKGIWLPFGEILPLQKTKEKPYKNQEKKEKNKEKQKKTYFSLFLCQE